MTQQDISTVLLLIDQWVESLSAGQLNHQCRKSGSDFYAYMTSASVNAGMLTNLIINATGLHPRQLCTVDDAETLRNAIRNYESAIYVGKHTGQAKKAAKHFWS